MRTLATTFCCMISFATLASAQDFAVASVDPYSLEAATQGPALPKLGEFHVDYARKAAAFEAPIPEVRADAWKPPEPEWIDPSLSIVGGGKVKPDIKHRGLKVAFQIWNADDPDDDEAGAN